MITFAAALQATQLVDSSVATTRAFWREKMGFGWCKEDGRLLSEIVKDDGINEEQRERLTRFLKYQNALWGK